MVYEDEIVDSSWEEKDKEEDYDPDDEENHNEGCV
jgi:hypothetical protein